MMQGYSLSATLPEDTGLGERFWYWRGASGQAYIHSIYSRDLCPLVAGAVYVLVRNSPRGKEPIRVGCFGRDGMLPPLRNVPPQEEEIHVHLLARDAETAERVLRDLEAASDSVTPTAPETPVYGKPVQLDLLAA
jgi:hypothetical protein